MVDPGPSQTLTFLDEREESINDGFMAISMTGYLPPIGEPEPGTLTLVDYPAYWHDRGAAVAFADGHVAVRRWTDPRTTPAPHPAPFLMPLNVSSPGNADVRWLQDHATSLRP